MIDNVNDIEKDLYEDRYIDKESFKTEFKKSNAHYMILKAISKELTIIINYWRYSPC